MSRRSRLLPVLVAALALAAACSADPADDRAGSDGTGPPPTATPVDPPTTDPAPEQAALDPTAVTVEPTVEPVGRTVEGTIETEDGRVRRYRTYVPSTVDASPGSAPVPLLLAFHGGGGWGAQFAANSGFDGLAEANGFLVAYPDGTEGTADGSGLRTWNGGACCGYAASAGVDDVAFVDRLLDELEATYAVDPDRVVAAGHSNGAILSYRLACELSDRIVAIGVQAGALEVESCRPGQPVSVLHLHGDADENLPIDGGRGPRSIAGVDFSAPLDGAATLAAADGCDPDPVRAPTPGRTDLTATSWTGCDDGSSVTFVAVAGASHAWMGGTIAGGPGGDAYPDLDSSLQIWDFLSRQARG